MSFSKDEIAERLAQEHYGVESGVKQIFRLLASDELEQSQDEPIKLLEVNEDTVPVGIVPIYFGPHAASGILCPSIIVEVSPEEFTTELKHQLQRDFGWSLGRCYDRQPTAGAASG